MARSIAIEASTRLEAAREGERLRTALIDSLTHELRTPLTSIRAAATTLLEGEGLDEAGRLDMVRIIDEEAARLDLLIGEAVEMAEIDANVVQVKMSPQHPRALLDQAVEESRKILASHKVNISVDEADSGRSRQAGLVRSASAGQGSAPPAGKCGQLHSAGQPRHAQQQTRRATGWSSRVEDNGPGIDALDLPLIFEKFYRGKRGSQRTQRVRHGPGNHPRHSDRARRRQGRVGGRIPKTQDSALIVLSFNCAGDFTIYDATKLLAAQGPRGKQVVTLTGVKNAGETMLNGASKPLDLTKPLETTWQLMQKFGLAGIEHILTGYDHICFLIAVILWATRVWPVVKIVTAFTISHSITLSLAALDIVTLPTMLTESAIAASIIYVAVENYFSRDTDKRWRDTFFFGFIHGFGFASGLKELNSNTYQSVT